MIDRREILEHAGELSLRPDVVEKDYVLGWLLAGIGAHAEISNSWIFKGGTCLKKCSFETYRFSEDLDFTLRDVIHLKDDVLKKTFQEIGDWVYDASGIEIPRETLRFDVYENPRGKPSVQGRVSYRGPISPGGDSPRIKLDLTNDEMVAASPVKRKVFHDYSDDFGENFQVLCYPYEEIFAEKLRALSERKLPRDLYDVIHLYRHPEIKPDREAVKSILRQKCDFKGIRIPTFQTVGSLRSELEVEWSRMLAHQLPSLPPFAQFWEELPQVFNWIDSGTGLPSLQPMTAMDQDLNLEWVPPPAAHAWGAGAPLEKIRFAGANRLCINLGYDGTTRIIEPYSLRKSKDGNLLLYAVRSDNRESRSYRVDRIQSAEITQRVFIPQFTVELTPTGPIHAPPPSQDTPSWGSVVGRAARFSKKPMRQTLKYVIECSLCRKKFTRSTRTTALKPHKDKNGYACNGRRGYVVDTRYT